MKPKLIKESSWVLISCADKFLLARRSAGVGSPNLWNFFGGGVEEGETPAQCASRELYEEAHIRLNDPYVDSRLVYLQHHVVTTAKNTRLERYLHFFGLSVDREFTPRLNAEHSEARWLTLDSIPVDKCHYPTSVACQLHIPAKWLTLSAP
jgi:8-oxo-dGTP diphosphatase